MNIDHIALWVHDIEEMRNFYVKYFELVPGARYSNPQRGFCSYFLSFKSGARLELMHMTGVKNSGRDPEANFAGLAHFAISVGSREKVDSLTSVLKADGYRVLDGPRTTGDGYYESSVLDPEGNRIEITI